MYVKTLRNRGSIMVIEANAEVLFTPAGDFGRWANRFSNRATAFAAQYAPANKRPRWAHYGKPLKTTFTSKTKYQPGRLKVYSGIGSRSPYALYVDQGTGVFAGRGAYPAKILPPWHRGSPSLYEASWKVPESVGYGLDGRKHVVWRRLGEVMIKGQKPQYFMDNAIQAAFRSMRTRAYQVPGDLRLAEASGSTPTGLEGFSGATPWSFAFDAQLREWRAWRDEAWNNHLKLGDSAEGLAYRGSRRPRKVRKLRSNRRTPAAEAYRREQARLRAQRWRDKRKSFEKPKQKRPKDDAARYQKLMKADKAALIKVMQQRYGSRFDKNSVELIGDRWEFLVLHGRDEFRVHSVRAKFIERYHAGS